MVRKQPQQPAQPIRELYTGVLRGIMAEHGINHRQVDYRLRADATFEEVVQYTYAYRGYQWSAHYRYDRCHEVLRQVPIPGQRLAHVDIGCGAGMFSWALLDWARENGLAYDHIDLYGLDHSSQMLRLAHQMRQGLSRNIANYPALRYNHDSNSLMEVISENHQVGMRYVVTFGHVLVQTSQDRNAVLNFTRVIGHVVGLLAGQDGCHVVAVDTHSRRRRGPGQFANAWNSLLRALTAAGIQHQQVARRHSRSSAVVQLYQPAPSS